MRVLVTGGAQFIGSALIRMMVRDTNASVLNLDKLTYAGNLSTLESVAGAGNYRFVQGDICDRELVDKLLAEFQPTQLVHLAAESHVDRSITGSAEFVRTNVVGTHTLLESALRYWDRLSLASKADFRFLHVSTDEVYGSLGDTGLFHETTAYDPRSPYSASKAASDHLAKAWHHTFGLPVVVSNCSNNYGPYQFPEKLIPVMILNALEGHPLPVYGDGRNIRDWLYVDDHARALRLILNKGQPGETYNVGGRNERKNIEVVYAVCDILDELAPSPAIKSRRGLVEFVTDRPGHDRRYAIDAGKLEQNLGWRAERPFDIGIRETIRWYLDNRSWWEPLRRARAGTERLGLRSAH